MDVLVTVTAGNELRYDGFKHGAGAQVNLPLEAAKEFKKQGVVVFEEPRPVVKPSPRKEDV